MRQNGPKKHTQCSTRDRSAPIGPSGYAHYAKAAADYFKSNPHDASPAPSAPQAAAVGEGGGEIAVEGPPGDGGAARGDAGLESDAAKSRIDLAGKTGVLLLNRDSSRIDPGDELGAVMGQLGLSAGERDQLQYVGVTNAVKRA